MERFSDGAGGSVTLSATNGTASVNVPMFTNYKFKFTNPNYRVQFTSSDGNANDLLCIIPNFYRSLAFRVYVSAGPDYSLNFFRCCPFIYRYTRPLASTT